MMTNIPVSRKRCSRQRGETLVESALVLVTLLSTILFIMDIGRLMLFQQFYTERARAAVRQAVVNNWSSTDVANFVAYNTTTPPAGVHPVGFLGIDPSNVTVTTVGTVGSATQGLQVTVDGITLFAWIPHMSSSYRAPAVTAVMPMQSNGATN